VVYYHNGQYRTSHALPYRLADEWMFIHAFWDWRQQATDRRLRRSEPTPANLREILYGPCLLEFVARETHSSACRILPELTAPGAISRAAIGDLLHEPLMEDSDTLGRKSDLAGDPGSARPLAALSPGGTGRTDSARCPVQ
jgi:hypothetical protein